MLFPIKINAIGLRTPGFSLIDVTGTLPTNSVQTVQLEPGSYRLLTHGTADTTWQFEITPEGLVDYQPSLDVTQGGFLSDRGTMTLTLIGLPVTLDARELSNDRYLILGVTDWLTNTEPYTLRLLPGSYSIVQGNGLVTEVAFTLNSNGLIDYAAESNAFLAGRGTNSINFIGLPVTLDARELTTDRYLIPGISDWLANTEPHTLRVLPGSYLIVQSNGLIADAEFILNGNGLVAYTPENDTFLTGRGTNTINFIGLPVTLDARELTTDRYLILGISDWLTNTEPHTLRLLPGSYLIVQGNGLVTDTEFTLKRSGLIDYAPKNNEIFAGRGTNTINFIGLSVSLDGRELAIDRYLVVGITDWLTSNELHILRILPGSYLLAQNSGLVPRGAFNILVNGTIGYEPDLDINVGGYLAGSGTTEFRLRGHPVSIDTTEFAGSDIVLLPQNIPINTSAGQVQTLNLLPEYNLQLALRSPPPQNAMFDLLPNGSIRLHEPYPFVAIDRLDNHPLIRLTQNQLRQRQPCRRPAIQQRI
jgi:hypothetical protein